MADVSDLRKALDILATYKEPEADSGTWHSEHDQSWFTGPKECERGVRRVRQATRGYQDHFLVLQRRAPHLQRLLEQGRKRRGLGHGHQQPDSAP